MAKIFDRLKSFDSDFLVSLESGIDFFHSNQLHAAQEEFRLAKRKSLSKDEFLLSHLYFCWALYRLKPFSVTSHYYISQINVASGEVGLVEEYRLRILCEVLRNTSKKEWCIRSHEKLWCKYQNFSDGLHYFSVLIRYDFDGSRIIRLVDDLKDKFNKEIKQNQKKFCLIMYKYHLRRGDLINAIDKLNELCVVRGEVPKWVNKEVERLRQRISGAEDVYYQLLNGDKSVFNFLKSKHGDITIEEAKLDINAAVVFSNLNSVYRKVDHYLSVFSVQESLPIIKFAMAYFPKSKFKQLNIPNQFQYLDIALLQCHSKHEFLKWADNCEGNLEGVNLELMKIIRECPRYLGGNTLTSFHGESSVFHFRTKKVLVIGFCGLHGDMFMPISTFSYFIESRGDISHLWLNDLTASNFVNGIPNYGDSLLELASRLKEFIDEYEFEKVVCIGSSAGGSAAAFFAWHLGADHAICLSAPTFVDVENTDRNPSALYKSFVNKGIKLTIDLKAFYSTPNSPRLTLYYGQENKIDVKYAENMKGLVNVEHLPLKGVADHSIVSHMIQIGELQNLVDKL